MLVEEIEEIREAVKSEPCILQCSANAPYDGCRYEPNYWLLKEGLVYPIYVSGRAYKWFDLNTCESPGSIIMHSTDVEGFVQRMDDMGRGEYDDWEVFSIDDVSPNPNALNAMTMILNTHEVDLPSWGCDICGQCCTGLVRWLGYTGNGGIGVTLTDPCCQQCFDQLRWCDSCFRHVTAKWDSKKDELVCPEYDLDDDEKHELSEVVDEAESFGLTGYEFLGPDGDAEGLDGVSIVIAQKI
jgi:hypothetical protein